METFTMKKIIAFAVVVAATGTMSVLSVDLTTHAYAACRVNYADCSEVVILVCGNMTFVGNSDGGNAEDIARIKARAAGFDPDKCRVRSR
jgi:hypothetical protein